MKLSRIMVPVDYSEQSRRALEYAAEVALAFSATLDVVSFDNAAQADIVLKPDASGKLTAARG